MARLIASLFVCLALVSRVAAQPADVWLDVDPANGIGEIDDGLMLLQAFHSPEVNVRGVSVVFGNAELKRAYPIALNIVRTFGPPDMPVHRGASAKEELGQSNPAVEAMAAALREKPMAILAVGPVTNVGSLVRLHPELNERITEIVVVAARRPGQKFLSVPTQPRPFRDMNFEFDPPAMQAILDTEIPLVFAPWEVSSHVWLTRDDLRSLRERSDAGLYVFATSQQWIDGWEARGAPGGNPFDTLALGYVTHPHLIRGMPVNARIEDGPEDQPGKEGETKPYLLVEELPAGAEQPRRMIYLHTPEPGFKDVLLERLAGRP